MRVLVACEFSGTVRDAFAAKGWDAWSCDLLPTEIPGNHIQGDVLEVLDQGWDLMIAHPPCQYLSYAGIAHWNKPGRAEKRQSAFAFFMALVNAPISKICVENPRGWPHVAYRRPDQVIHPYMFGDPAMKRTGLWLKNLPPLLWWPVGSLFGETEVAIPEPLSIDPPTARNPNKKRWFVDAATRDPLERARTFPSIAAAMAAQWG